MEEIIEEVRHRLFDDGMVAVRIVPYNERELAVRLLPGPDIVLGKGRSEVAAIKAFFKLCFPEFSQVRRARTLEDIAISISGYDLVKNITARWIVIQRARGLKQTT